MSKNNINVTSAMVVVLSLAFAGSPAVAGIIDDFDTPGLSEYTFSKVLDQGDGTTNISFSDAGGTIDVVSTGTSGAEQALLLRNDGTTLDQGRELQLSVPTTFNNRDFGPAIGASHADLGAGVAGDNRNTADYVFITWRTSTFLNSRGFIGGNDISLGQNTTGPADLLFIARTFADDIELGWYEGSTRNVARTLTPTTLDIFNNVGFYADLRGDGEGFSGADNLKIIPEPASLALAGLSLIGLMANRRTRK